jgi:meiosis-specific transcription factor NDT80
MLPPSRSQGLGNHPLSPTLRDNYTTATPGLNRHMVSPRSQLDHIPRSPFATSDPPRSLITPHPNMALSSASYGPASSFTHGTRGQNESPPFQDQDNFHEIRTDDGQSVVRPNIQAKVEKGFFMSQDNCWTCYRRNYFSVQCSYSLDPHISNRSLYLMRTDKKTGSNNLEQIQAMAMSLSAAVDGASGKAVDLVQHTPKRDRGPQTAVQKTKLLPTPPGSKGPAHIAADPHGFPLGTFGFPSQQSTTIPPPYLPQQHSQDSAPSSSAADQSNSSSSTPTASYSGSHTTPTTATTHIFERIQFKSATANNGKRRAQQQYYTLIVELWADVRQSGDRNPNWVKIAQRPSSQVVVRGRSPSHYSNEGPNSVGRGGAGGGLGGRPGLSSGHWGNVGGLGGGHSYGGSATLARYGSMGSGGPGVGFALGGHSSSTGAHPTDAHHLASMSDNALPSVDSLSLPSSGSSSGSLVPVQLDDRITDEDSKLDTYSYFPGPLYEAGLASPKVESKSGNHVRRSEESTTSGNTAHHYLPSPWATNTCRLVGLESSRGLYPWGNPGPETGY